MPFQFYCPQGHLLEGHESQMGRQSQCPMCGSVFVVPLTPGGSLPGGMMPQPGAMQPGAMPQAGWPGYPQPGMPGHSQPLPPGYPPMYPQGGYPGYALGYPGFAGGTMPAEPAIAPGTAGYPSISPEQQYAGGGFPGAGVSQPPGFAAEEPGPSFPAIQTEPQPAAATKTPAAPPTATEQPTAAEEPKEPRVVRIPCPQGHELQTPTDMLDQEVLCPICGTQFHLRYEDSVEYKQELVERRLRQAEQLNKAALKWAIIAAVVIVLAIIGMIIYLAARTKSEGEYLPAEGPAKEEPAEASAKPEGPSEKLAEPEGDGDRKE